MEKMQAQPG